MATGLKMSNDLVKRLRYWSEGDAYLSPLSTRIILDDAADCIEELDALVDRLIVAGRDLCCHIPSSDLMIGVSEETKAVLENVIWKEGKNDR